MRDSIIRQAYHITSSQHASEVIGVIELAIAGLIVVRRWFPTLSGIGSLAGSVMFLVTLLFLVTTPKLSAADHGFLIKDLFLLGGCIVTAGEALLAGLLMRSRVVPIVSDFQEPERL